MHSFDENILLGELRILSSRARVAFAAASATRQLKNYERLGKKQRPREIAEQLWVDVQVAAIDRDAWSTRLDEVMDLLPEDGGDWAIGHALADDALSSLAYAIRCLLTFEPQESAWAARRAYEAADQAAIRALGIKSGLPESEMAIKAHKFVQRELARQRNDLALLHADLVDEVRRQSFAGELLTDQEAASLV